MKRHPLPAAIVLAGGRGTRLKNITSRVPKPMLEIHGKPFLAYILDHLDSQGIREIVLSIGYEPDMIKEFFLNAYGNIRIRYAIEHHPLGTGGAIVNSLRFVDDKRVIVLNGDTFFPVRLARLLEFHETRSSRVTLGLKQMRNAERYGAVSIDKEGKVIDFNEKRHPTPGLINGGTYVIGREALHDIGLPESFSFEHDFLEKHVHEGCFYGLPFNEDFVDIGVPDDYERAKAKLKRIGN